MAMFKKVCWALDMCHILIWWKALSPKAPGTSLQFIIDMERCFWWGQFQSYFSTRLLALKEQSSEQNKLCAEPFQLPPTATPVPQEVPKQSALVLQLLKRMWFWWWRNYGNQHTSSSACTKKMRYNLKLLSLLDVPSIQPVIQQAMPPIYQM